MLRGETRPELGVKIDVSLGDIEEGRECVFVDNTWRLL